MIFIFRKTAYSEVMKSQKESETMKIMTLCIALPRAVHGGREESERSEVEHNRNAEICAARLAFVRSRLPLGHHVDYAKNLAVEVCIDAFNQLKV